MVRVLLVEDDLRVARVNRKWLERDERVDVVMVTAAGDEATVRGALAYGVLDDLIQLFGGSRLTEAVARHRLRARLAQDAFSQADLDRFRGLQTGGRGPRPCPREWTPAPWRG